MSRPLRVLFPGAVYHVTSRGNERGPIYRDATDRRRFLDELRIAVDRYGALCHAYCMMDNHYHALIETPRANLPIAMRHLNGCYTRAFNARWRRTGHLFEGRYKAVLVEKDAHLLETIRYIVLNPTWTDPPLRHRPEDWPWSSYRATLGLTEAAPWLSVDWVLRQFGPSYRDARLKLRAFVNGPLEPSSASDTVFFAGERFIRAQAGGLQAVPEIPRPHWQPLRPTLEEIFSTKPEPIAAAYREYGYRLREIAEYCGCHYATISRRLRRSERDEWSRPDGGAV